MNDTTALPTAPARGRPGTATRRERDAAISARRAEGWSLAAIADEFGMTRERVRQIVREQGGPGRTDVRRIRQAQVAATRAALRDRCLEHLAAHPGLTLTALSDALGAEPAEGPASAPSILEALDALDDWDDADRADSWLRQRAVPRYGFGQLL